MIRIQGTIGFICIIVNVAIFITHYIKRRKIEARVSAICDKCSDKPAGCAECIGSNIGDRD